MAAVLYTIFIIIIEDLLPNLFDLPGRQTCGGTPEMDTERVRSSAGRITGSSKLTDLTATFPVSTATGINRGFFYDAYR